MTTTALYARQSFSINAAKSKRAGKSYSLNGCILNRALYGALRNDGAISAAGGGSHQ